MPDNPKLAPGAAIVLVLMLMPIFAYTFTAFIVPFASMGKYGGMRKYL